MTISHAAAHLFLPGAVKVPSAANFIAGQVVHGDGREFAVLRPSDGGLLGDMRGASPAQLDQACANAAEAQKRSGWATMEPRGRMKLLRRWADLIEGDAATLAPLEAAGSTRTLIEIRA